MNPKPVHYEFQDIWYFYEVSQFKNVRSYDSPLSSRSLWVERTYYGYRVPKINTRVVSWQYPCEAEMITKLGPHTVGCINTCDDARYDTHKECIAYIEKELKKLKLGDEVFNATEVKR